MNESANVRYVIASGERLSASRTPYTSGLSSSNSTTSASSSCQGLSRSHHGDARRRLMGAPSSVFERLRTEVRREPGVIRERGVQQSERVRKIDLPLRRETVALAKPHPRRRPP